MKLGGNTDTYEARFKCMCLRSHVHFKQGCGNTDQQIPTPG